MGVPGSNERGRDSRYFIAAEEAARLEEESRALLERAVGVEWYTQGGTDVDLVALTLCRLRRARGGEKGSPQHGDEAVRRALSQASTSALVWIASRAVSYMDEMGFPEAVEPWFPEEAARGQTPRV